MVVVPQLPKGGRGLRLCGAYQPKLPLLYVAPSFAPTTYVSTINIFRLETLPIRIYRAYLIIFDKVFIYLLWRSKDKGSHYLNGSGILEYRFNCMLLPSPSLYTQGWASFNIKSVFSKM